MKELESNNHSVFSLNFHLVLVVKYRRKVIDDEISERLREIFEYIEPAYKIMRRCETAGKTGSIRKAIALRNNMI